MSYRNTFQWVILTQPLSTLFIHAFVVVALWALASNPPAEVGWTVFLWVFLLGILALFWWQSTLSFRSKPFAPGNRKRQ